jgi:PhnB protein
MTAGKTTPARYRNAVIPHIMIDGASAAIEYYQRAFGAIELFRIASPNGRVLHAEITIEDSLIMLGDPDDMFDDPSTLGGCAAGLHVYVDNVDALVARAVDAGAELLQPSQDMFYGDRQAMVRDPFGHIWVLLQHLEDMSPAEIARRGIAALAQDTNAEDARELLVHDIRT